MFARTARAAGLSGLVLQHAVTHDLAVPQRVYTSLRKAATVIAGSNLNRFAELERILGALQRSDIPAMLLKGAALNLSLYDRPDHRPMSDVDILVRPESAQHAVDCLVKNGCRRGFALLRDDFFPRYYYEVELITESIHPERIDLHGYPFRPMRLSRTIPDDAFWDAARTVQVGEATALIPRPEIMFLHLAAHAAFHGCSRLIWLYDVARWAWVYGDSMDWGLIGRRAEDWGLAPAVAETIARTEDYFGRVCPRDLSERLAAVRSGWRDRLMLAHAPNESASPIAHVVVNLLCTPGVRFRVGYLLALLLPGRDHLAEIYRYRHPGWWIGAHLWRGVRAMRRLVAMFVSLILSTFRALSGRIMPSNHRETRRGPREEAKCVAMPLPPV